MHTISVVQTKYSLFTIFLLASLQDRIPKVDMSNTGSSRGAAQKPVGVEAAQKEVITNAVQFYLFAYTYNYYTHPLILSRSKERMQRTRANLKHS